LSETKLDEKGMTRFKRILEMGDMVVVDSEEKGGGELLCCGGGIDVSLRSKSKLHIDVDVKEANGRVWQFTRVYGESHSDQKFRTWEMLRGLSTPSDGPWLCAGDFNEILYNHEKEGGKCRPQSYMD
jgi:hypothetical protein